MTAPARPFRGKRVEKPWGYELIWAHTDRYVGKILHVEPGHSLSLQYHRRKDETLCLLTGLLRLEVGNSQKALRVLTLKPGESFHLPAGRLHRMTAIEASDVLEASTPELDDVVRLADLYGRAERKSPGRRRPGTRVRGTRATKTGDRAADRRSRPRRPIA